MDRGNKLVMKVVRFGDFLVLLLILASSLFSLSYLFGKKGSTAVIQTPDSVYEYPLSKDAVYEVEGEIGITRVEVRDGRVRIIDSPCPNKTCVNQSWGTVLVCLPNQIIVTTEESGGFDAIAE